MLSSNTFSQHAIEYKGRTCLHYCKRASLSVLLGQGKHLLYIRDDWVVGGGVELSGVHVLNGDIIEVQHSKSNKVTQIPSRRGGQEFVAISSRIVNEGSVEIGANVSSEWMVFDIRRTWNCAVLKRGTHD